MKVYEPDNIRNIAFVGSKGVGKTSFLDALLFVAGVNSRHGRVDDGTSVLDYDPQEQRRKQSMTSKISPIEWHGNKINCIDTPGFADFWGETVGAMWVADVIVVVVDAVSGMGPQSKKLYQMARQFGKPVAFLVNRMDQAGADLDRVCTHVRDILAVHAVTLEAPIGAGADFAGVVDLLHLKNYVTSGGKTVVSDITSDQRTQIDSARTTIMDDVAETEPALMDKYLGGEELSDQELHHGLAKGIEEGTISPVCCGSALTLAGAEAFLTMVVDWFPAPTEAPPINVALLDNQEAEERRPDLDSPFTAQVFKSTSDPGIGDIFFFRVYSGQVSHGEDVYNSSKRGVERMGHLFVMRGKERIEVDKVGAGDIASVAKLKAASIGDTLCAKQRAGICAKVPFPEPSISLAVTPKTKADLDKLGVGLQKLAAVDPSFRFHVDHEFSETVVEGLGEIHLEVTLERLRERFGIDFEIGKPRIPYRERLMKPVKVQGKYKKQSGGRGQYGDCWLEITPLPIATGYQFENKLFGGSIPSKYVPAIEKGVKDAMTKGLMSGYPIVDCKVTVYDGSYHDVDSSDLAFQIAGSMAFKKAEEESGAQLIEPIMNVEITVPQQYVGDVSSDVSGRRGRMSGMDTVDDTTVVKAQVPLSELYKYSTSLRAMTSGAGSYSMQFSHYEVVPGHVAQKVVAEAQKIKEAKDKEKH